MNKRIYFKAPILLVIVLLCASCANSNVKQDISCTKKILSAIELSKKATSAYDHGEFELAENLYKQVIGIDPDNERALFKLGNIYSNTERPSAAIDSYRKVLLINPQHSRARHNLGIVYLEQAQILLGTSKGNSDVFEEVVTQELKKYLQQLLEQM